MSDNESPTRYSVNPLLLEDTSASKPHIHIISTGGTISHPIDGGEYLSGDDFLKETPVLEEVAEITTHDITKTEDGHIQSRGTYIGDLYRESEGLQYDPVWFDIHDHITTQLDSDTPPDGFVITHGSNTAEETACFLDLTFNTDRPIVVTAAQRRHNMVGHEGQWNLTCAVRVAGHPDARDRGTLLVENDRIHTARDVTKLVSGRPDAWYSGDHGVLGLIGKDGLIKFYRRVEQQSSPTFDIKEERPAEFPRVEVIYSVAGADGRLVKAAVDGGADGIVVAAMPTGTPAYAQEPALKAAADAGVPVVLSHRGENGWPERKYIRDSSYIWGDTLSPQKARILLALGLQRSAATSDLQELFMRY